MGEVAERELEKLIAGATTIETIAGPRQDRYRRTLGRLPIDGRDVATIMIERGLAVPYNGRTKRRDWCR